jgi:hypothetical protein
MSLPDHTVRLATRLLSAYCASLCPPGVVSRVHLDFRIEAGHVTLFERRLICGVPGTLRAVDVVQLRFDAGGWRAYLPFNAGWRTLPGLGRERSLARLLRAIDLDVGGHCWPRFNGASLRFCSPRGRCEACARRYGAALERD